MSGLYNNLEDTRKGLLAFVAQLKAGKGLTLVAECVEGQFAQMAGAELDRIREARTPENVIDKSRLNAKFKDLHEEVKASRIRGFCDVLVAEQFVQGVSHLIQTSGLGGLRHNRFHSPPLNSHFGPFPSPNTIHLVQCRVRMARELVGNWQSSYLVR